MAMVALTFLALLFPKADCEAAKSKRAELAAAHDSWLRGHRRECTLCSETSFCQDGFARKETSRKAFETWRAGHAPACDTCVDGCPAADRQLAVIAADIQEKHRVRCATCEADPSVCTGWMAGLALARARHAEWKRDHAGVCERCAPDCPDWKRRADEMVVKTGDALKRHREHCSDCDGGACDRADRLRLEAAQQRQILWRGHVERCRCMKAAKK